MVCGMKCGNFYIHIHLFQGKDGTVFVGHGMVGGREFPGQFMPNEARILPSQWRKLELGDLREGKHERDD